MSTRGQWVDAFLRAGQFPTTHQNEVAVLAWARSEFGTEAPCPAAYNLLATTYHEGRASNFNDVGVQNFKNLAEGVDANAHVVHEDHPGYQQVRDALTVGLDAVAVVNAVHASAWGSKPTPELVSAVLARWPYDAQLWLGADDQDTHPTPQAIAPPWPGVELHNFTAGHGTREWQAQMRHRGWSIAVDDQYGPQSEHVCTEFQAEKALQVDGIVGPQTWGAAWTAPIT